MVADSTPEQALQVGIGAYELPGTEAMPVHASQERPLLLRPPDAVLARHSSLGSSGDPALAVTSPLVCVWAALSWALVGFFGGKLLVAPELTWRSVSSRLEGFAQITQEGMRLQLLIRPTRQLLHRVVAYSRPKIAAEQSVPVFTIADRGPGPVRQAILDTLDAKQSFEQQHQHHKRRKVQLEPYYCPCCIQPCLTPPKLGVHIQKCCPDLFNAQVSSVTQGDCFVR